MKKIITLSVYLFGLTFVMMAANVPEIWQHYVDTTHDGRLFRTASATQPSAEATALQQWLDVAPTSPEGLLLTCNDNAGTVTRTLQNGNPATIIEPLCWGQNYTVAHNGDGNFSGDGDLNTPAGLDLMIFTDIPTASGPLVSDISSNLGYTGQIVGTDALGNIVFNNQGVYQNFFGTTPNGYTELWFAPVTLDDVSATPKVISEDVGGVNECVNVNVAQAFSIVFLDSIHISNLITPTGGNTCQASFMVSGGLMAYNGNSYGVSITQVNDPTITGTVTVNPNPVHNSSVVFTVPQAGLYNLTVSGGCETKTVVVNMSACIACTDDAGTLTTTSTAPNPVYLCFGDTLFVNHDGNQNVAGDPNPLTTPGLQYAIYTCMPTISGNTLPQITADPCLITNGTGTVPQLAPNIDINGNGFLANTSGLFQGYLTNAGLNIYDTLFFAPITVDAFPPATWEGVNGANECTNVNVNAAFPVIFLSSIIINTVNNQSGGNLCRGEVVALGGLPEADGSNYIVTIELLTDPTITGTVITPASHNGATVFEVPQPGNYRIIVTDNNGCTTSVAFVGMTACPVPCASFTFDATTGIGSNYNGANISCSGANDGAINISTTNGTYPFTYQWTHAPALTDSTATNLAPGSYSVTVTDANGCDIDTTITLTSPSPLFVGVGGQNPLCAGAATGQVFVNNIGGGTLPYTFTWSNGVSGTADTIFNLTAGNYALTVTDANGCTAQASTTLGDPPVLNGNFTTVTDATCLGVNDGSATIVPSGGTAPYSFAWSNGVLSTTASANNLAPATYTVTITDNNLCTFVDSTVVGIDLTVSATEIIIDVTCFNGNDGSIAVTPSTSGGAPNLPYSFAWSNGTNNSLAANLTAGNYTYTVTDNVGCIYTDSATVQQPDSITITNTSVSNVLCNGAATGSITVSASGGAGNYTYDWGNGNIDSTLLNVAAGSYAVTVTDANGCTNTATYTLTQPAAITTTSSITPVSCNGFADGALTIAASGGAGNFTFVWNTTPVSNADTISNLVAGTYFVTTTDADGCSITDTLIVNEPAALTVNIATINPSCFNTTDGELTATAAGGTTPYVFAWSTNDTTATVSNLTAGNYSVTLTDANNCSAITTATLIAPPTILTTLSTTPVSCAGGSDGTATVTASGGAGNFTYLWNNGQTGATVAQLGAGIYFVTATDGAGCFVEDTVSVEELPALNPAGGIIANPVSCFGGNDGSIQIFGTTGGTAPYSYTWSVTGAVDTSAIANLTAGVYSVQITDANNCNFGPINVTVNQPANPINLTSTTLDPSCSGFNDGSIAVIATGGTPSYTYLWADGQVGQVAADLTAGIYGVTVTDANGCTDSITTTLAEPQQLVAELSTIATSCNGTRDGRIVADTIYGGTEPYAYSIDDINYQPTDIIFFGLAGGNYDVYVQDANGCEVVQQVLIDEPLLITVDLGADVTLELGRDLTLEAIVNTNTPLTYTWTATPADATMTCMDCATPNVAPVRSTTYTVTVEDTTGCTATDDVRIKIDKNRNVFIPNVITPNGDGRNDVFHVFAGAGVSQVRTFIIYDRWGSQLFAQTNVQPNDPTVGWDGTFRGKDMQPGVYVFFIEVEFADGLIFPYKGDITLIR